MKYIFFNQDISQYEKSINNDFNVYTVNYLITDIKKMHYMMVRVIRYRIADLEWKKRSLAYIDLNDVKNKEAYNDKFLNNYIGLNNGKYLCTNIASIIIRKLKVEKILTPTNNRIIKKDVEKNLITIYDKVKNNIIDYGDGSIIKDYYEKVCLDIFNNDVVSRNFNKLKNVIIKECKKPGVFNCYDYTKSYDNIEPLNNDYLEGNFDGIVTKLVDVVLQKYIYSLITVKINKYLVKNKMFQYIANDFNMHFVRLANIVNDDRNEMNEDMKELRFKSLYKCIYNFYYDISRQLLRQIKKYGKTPIEYLDKQSGTHTEFMKCVSYMFEDNFLSLQNLINKTNKNDENYLNYREDCLIDRESFDTNWLNFRNKLIENVVNIFKNLAFLTISSPSSFEYYIKAVDKMLKPNGLAKTVEALKSKDYVVFDNLKFKEGLIHDAKLSKPFTRYVKRSGENQEIVDNLIRTVSDSIKKIVNVLDPESVIYHLTNIYRHIFMVRENMYLLNMDILRTNIESVLGDYENINNRIIKIYPKIKDNKAHFSRLYH